MKNWTSKKSLRITIEALREENSELQQRLSDQTRSTQEWMDAAARYCDDFKSAYQRIAELQAKLNKFHRQRGTNGKYVKKMK